MFKDKKVVVIMPAYNAEKTLKKTWGGDVKGIVTVIEADICRWNTRIYQQYKDVLNAVLEDEEIKEGFSSFSFSHFTHTYSFHTKFCHRMRECVAEFCKTLKNSRHTL